MFLDARFFTMSFGHWNLSRFSTTHDNNNIYQMLEYTTVHDEEKVQFIMKQMMDYIYECCWTVGCNFEMKLE